MNIKTIFEDANSSDKVPELTLTFKRPKIKNRKLDTTEEQVEFLREIFDPNTFELNEELILLILDPHFNPICYYRLAKGNSDSVGTDYKLIFGILNAVQANVFILAHNHPVDNALPSYQDVQFNHSVMMLSKQLGMLFYDSITIGELNKPEEEEDSGYFSFRENELFFDEGFE